MEDCVTTPGFVPAFTKFAGPHNRAKIYSGCVSHCDCSGICAATLDTTYECDLQ